MRTGAGFNCNFLYRQIKEEADIIVFSDDRNTVINPMGEPGRDIDENKISHIMVVSHASDGPVTFNECLPTTEEEDKDSAQRIDLVKRAVMFLRNNARVSLCGPKVVEKVKRLGLSMDMGIRDFFLYQILALTPEKIAGPPGYVLMEGGTNIATNRDKLAEVIARVFQDKTLIPMTFIQGPYRNTQLLSHIHCFMIDATKDLPDSLNENYLNVELIQCAKYELKNGPEVKWSEVGDFDSCELVRTTTPPIFNSEPEPEDEEDCDLTRQLSSAPPVCS